MLPRLDYIKQARTKLGITQRELASLAGVSTSMINQIESGRCKPSYDTAKKISWYAYCRRYGTSASDSRPLYSG